LFARVVRRIERKGFGVFFHRCFFSASFTVSGCDACSSRGPESGETVVTLTGTNLVGVLHVLFGSVDGTSLTHVSNTEITVVSPPGTGTVAVTLQGGAKRSDKLDHEKRGSVFFMYLASAGNE
jgi:hypothetical protein